MTAERALRSHAARALRSHAPSRVGLGPRAGAGQLEAHARRHQVLVLVLWKNLFATGADLLLVDVEQELHLVRKLDVHRLADEAARGALRDLTDPPDARRETWRETLA